MNYASVTENSSKKERKEQNKVVLELFKPFFKLEDKSGYEYEFTHGYWTVYPSNCVINYKTDVTLVAKTFSKTATKSEIHKLILSMVEESKNKIKRIKNGILHIEDNMDEEYDFLKNL